MDTSQTQSSQYREVPLERRTITGSWCGREQKRDGLHNGCVGLAIAMLAGTKTGVLILLAPIAARSHNNQMRTALPLGDMQYAGLACMRAQQIHTIIHWLASIAQCTMDSVKNVGRSGVLSSSGAASSHRSRRSAEQYADVCLGRRT
ncbi:hypothetical protein IW136_001448 [Coemansia sp. RSA 678]|nr:hypothetical protein IW136_001448 [Coemansia sp. RSA 678]